MGKRKEAVGKHEKALKLSPDYAPSLNNLAYLYAEGFGPLDKAHEMAKRAREIAPKDGSVADTLGWLLFKKDKYEEALRYFEEALRYLPEEPTIHYHVGLAYLKVGNTDKSKSQLEQSILLGQKSDFPEADTAEKLLKEIMAK
jgi:Tfp pilus assembly protein PilF